MSVTQQNGNATQFSGGADMLGDPLAVDPISVGSCIIQLLGACILGSWPFGLKIVCKNC